MGYMSEENKLFVLEAIKRGYIKCDDEGSIHRYKNRTGSLVEIPVINNGYKNKSGYRCVGISVDKIAKYLMLHNVVWIYFNGIFKEGLENNHIDGNKSNNKLLNLELVTHSGNIQHAVKLGLRDNAAMKGEKNPRSKLTWKKVRQIRKEYVKGRENEWNTVALGKKYGVNKTTISGIIRNKIWKEDL